MSDKYQKIVVFAGYSNSGKTNFLIPLLKECNYTVFSSSKILHQFVEKLLKELLDLDFDSYDRNVYLQVQNEKLYSRELCILSAEKILVPVFGRKIFINSFIDKITMELSIEKNVAIETIGGEEYEFIKKELNSRNLEFTSFNLRRTQENPKIDIRELIPDCINIHNNGDYTDLKAMLEAVLLVQN